MRRSIILAAISSTIALGMLAGSLANAQSIQRVQVGILECRGGASVGFIVGSVTNLGCVLRVPGFPEDRYVATIRKVGVDLGITQESALAWRLGARGATRAGRTLRQLRRRAGQRRGRRRRRRQCVVGGSDNSIALQPLSVQGQVGLSVAAGLESLELRPGR